MILEPLQDEKEYRRIHELVFNTTPEPLPQHVIVGRNSDRDIVGFISGFWNSNDSFYIQWAGVLPAYQKGAYLRHFGQILDPNTTYDMAVENTNTVTIKLVLSVGFIPIGVILQGNKLFVQLKREKHG